MVRLGNECWGAQLRRVVSQSTLVEFLRAEMMELSFFEMSQRREHYTLLACILRQLATVPATVPLLSALRFDSLYMQATVFLQSCGQGSVEAAAAVVEQSAGAPAASPAVPLAAAAAAAAAANGAGLSSPAGAAPVRRWFEPRGRNSG